MPSTACIVFVCVHICTHAQTAMCLYMIIACGFVRANVCIAMIKSHSLNCDAEHPSGEAADDAASRVPCLGTKCLW